MDSEEKEISPVEETSRNDHPEIDSNKPGDNPVELIRNENQIDITGDGGLLKEIRTMGEGDDGPLSGDKVFVHYSARRHEVRLQPRPRRRVQFRFRKRYQFDRRVQIKIIFCHECAFCTQSVIY